MNKCTLRRHTSDFLLWDSATSDCDVGKNSIKTDIVKQYVEECRRQKIKPGIYYCLWGGKPRKFSKVKIHEGWDRIRKFELQIKKDDEWQTIHSDTTVGEDYSAEFKKVKAQHVRLNILEATDVPTIWEVELF